jgi:hypothetical protein
VGDRLVVLPAFSRWAGGTSASRLIELLPAGTWRAIPVNEGRVADVGIVVDSTPGNG